MIFHNYNKFKIVTQIKKINYQFLEKKRTQYIFMKNQRYAWEKPSVDSITIENLTFIQVYSK